MNRRKGRRGERTDTCEVRRAPRRVEGPVLRPQTPEFRRRASSCLLLGCLLAAGCRSYTAAYDPARAAELREKIQGIEPLELQPAEPDEAAPDANEPPPATLELSLEQCRALALENNLSLKAGLISPAIAAARLSAEEARFEASFLTNLRLGKSDRPPVSLYDQLIGSKVEERQADLGVRFPLRTGGTLTLSLSDYWRQDNRPGSDFNPIYAPTTDLSISHPLLRDAGQWVNTYTIRIATLDRDIISAGTKLEIITVLAALDRVYWRFYAARRELEVREQQYTLAQAQLERARRLVAAGQRPQVEVLRAEAGVAQQLEAIIVAENSLRDRERELKRVVNRAGLDVESPTIVVPTTLPDPVRYDLERPRLIRTALDSRMELLELQLQLLQDATTADYARNQTLPLATIDYTYSISGTGAGRDDAYDLLFDSDFVNHRGALQLAVPIGNEAAKSRWRQAIYTRRQRLATQANREDLIRLEVLNAIDQVEANWQRILAARQNSILNGRLFEAEQRQFEQGLRTSTEVLDAQTKFADAQSAEIRALADYQISRVDVAYATGTILGAARIQWQPIVPETGVE